MMRITLIKYISKEIWAIFFTGLFVFLFIIMASQMLNMTELVINYGASFDDLFGLIICLIPNYCLFAMPAACLMAVLLSFIRMASDNEIIALHSSGISIYQLMSPVFIFSLICLLFSIFLTMFWTPYGNRTFYSDEADLMKIGIESYIKEGIFIDELEDIVLYVNSYSPKDRVMKDVFAVYKHNGNVWTVIAKKAKIIPGKIRFMDCNVFTDGKNESPDFYMDTLDIPIDSLVDYSEDKKLEPDGMYLNELLELINNSEEDIKKKNIAKLKLYEMFSLPMAIFFIGIAGAPLGAQIRAHGRTKGIIISLLLFISYYISLISIEHLCENGKINPVIGTWIPVFFLLILCIIFLLRSAGKLSLNFIKR